MHAFNELPSYAISVQGGTPEDTDTVVLFNSVTCFGAGVFRNVRPNRITFAVENSHAGTLKQYRSTNGGTTWDQVGGDIAVGVPSATDISGPYDFLVDVHLDWKLEFTTTATQTTWRPNMEAISDRQPGV